MDDVMHHGLRVLAAHTALIRDGLTLGSAVALGLALSATLVVWASLVRSGQLQRLEERLADEHALRDPWGTSSSPEVYPSPAGRSQITPAVTRWTE
jgi:hypothetical protein